ncbi:XrtA/PEP-CTERM system exopolysaccharide export protein [Azospirillum picis]|uniref:Polysaccharide export outer membrane protein n=1 Tax=Azospirillum picis TaxID=488438 RepID=A0ABU0MRJ7_9PROT|nr:XrtA/PEP-CTERM system exopolysaccharide export protein [Azospirillum picis]MBP2300852.1 polysaccharide export outer membrane protein [Azospirillum picis]MDQ0536109.1 polysaccharide export outer membrane protein [Azospirillum picis]
MITGTMITGKRFARRAAPRRPSCPVPNCPVANGPTPAGPGRRRLGPALTLAGLLALAPLLAACGSAALEEAPLTVEQGGRAPDYRIGPLDTIHVEVWQAPEFSTTAPVRPDGRISMPMLQEVVAAGKTPEELARDIKKSLTAYMPDALVTVTLSSFADASEQQVQVVGEAVKPTAIRYRQRMRMLDVMIAAGGLTKFADGNRAVLVRQFGGGERSYRVRLDDLLKDGMVKANVPILPGDIVIIPETYF